ANASIVEVAKVEEGHVLGVEGERLELEASGDDGRRPHGAHAGGDPPGVDVVDLLVVELVGEVEHGPRHSPGGGELARVLLEGGGADEGVGACLEGPDAPGVAGDSGVADVEHAGS